MISGVSLPEFSVIHHLLSQEASPVGLVLQPLPQRVSAGPVHVDLTEHVKLSVVRLGKLFDLRFTARLLQSKTSDKIDKTGDY